MLKQEAFNHEVFCEKNYLTRNTRKYCSVNIRTTGKLSVYAVSSGGGRLSKYKYDEIVARSTEEVIFPASLYRRNHPCFGMGHIKGTVS